jgi:hypothetical protein
MQVLDKKGAVLRRFPIKRTVRVARCKEISSSFQLPILRVEAQPTRFRIRGFLPLFMFSLYSL